MEKNNDFDLIITDASRGYGTFYDRIAPEGLPKLDGVNFIKYIQTKWHVKEGICI